MSKLLKISSLVVGLAMVLSFVAVPASAATVDELMAQIAALTAQIAALKGGAATTAATFTRDLTVGSKGEDVSALQQILIDGGYLNVTAPTGYFGAMTKAALVKYQTENGISATGYFGPKTRAFVNASAGTTTGGTTTTTGTVVADGTDGSISASLDSYVGNQTLKKGETKDIYAIKLQASAGKVSVSRFDVVMSVRPWLYFNKLILKDSTGKVIAEKSISGASDATELTVGSKYLVRFENINYVIDPSDYKILVVSASVLPTTDKLSSDVSVTVYTDTNGIRTINGKGYTDSVGEATGRTVTLSSTGSTGNIVARTNSGSPAARIVTTSTSGETNGVVLGMFDFKAENQSATLNTLKFALKDKAGQEAFSTIFKRIYVNDGSRDWNADSVASTTQFSNLTIDLAKDTWKTLTLKADVADADDFTNGAMASTSMVVNNTNIVGIDANYTTVTATAANTIASNDITLLQSGASLSYSTPTGEFVDNGTSAISTSTAVFALTLNNTGSNDIYVSKTPSTFVATSTTAAAARLSSMTSGSTLAGDSTTYYVVPSGSSRTFTLSGDFGNDGGTSGLAKVSITKVYFDDDTTGLQEFNIDYGLENLYVQKYLNN